MANDVVRFVDSISASPTTRLDLNDGTTFTLRAAILADPPNIEAAALSPSSARAVWAEIIEQAQARRDQVKEDAPDA